MTDTKVLHPVLAELETRAGASDRDREAWLAERRLGVTATEVRDLVLKGAAFQQQLIDLKLGRRTDSFTGNAYTEWGKEREAALAPYIGSSWALAEESRVFRHPENVRWLASPDFTGVSFGEELLVGELKTSGKGIRVGTPQFDATGYALQMQWVMVVTGARRCLYVFEERIQVGDGFEPGAVHYEWIDYDEKIAGNLKKTADHFLVALDAARDSDAPVVDEEIDTHALNVLTGRVRESEGKALKESSWRALTDALTVRGGEFTQRSTLAQVTFTPGGESVVEVPDVEAAKAADPGLFAEVQELSKRWNEHAAQFTKEVPKVSAPKLTVTAVRQKGSK